MSESTFFFENVNGLDLQMIYVQGGSFMMGATPEQENDANDDEKPVHPVTLDSFYIGKYPVTQKQWQAVMGAGNNPSWFPQDDLPVEYVTWDDTQAFIQKINKLTGKNYRLPSEAEWEYAARGGTNSLNYKYAGGNHIDWVAWYYDNCRRGTHRVGINQPNELGAYDMSGNVWEWCEDDWHDNYNGAPSNGLAWIDDPRAAFRVLRGGSWNSRYAKDCRVSKRYKHPSGYRNYCNGFRLAVSSNIM